MGIPDSSQVGRALARARQGLGLAAGAPLEPAEASVFLKYLLLQGLNPEEAYAGGRLAEPSSGLHPRCHAWLLHQLSDPGSIDEIGPALQLFVSRPCYRSRVLDLVGEALQTERLAPEICLHPEPLAAAVALPSGAHRHAVVFAKTAGFAHEFYPLAVDAYVRDAARHGQPRVQVLGVRTDWLDADGAIHRAMFLEPERNRLVEADWVLAFRPHSVQFLCLGRQEQPLHRALATRFGCPQVNPHAPSALADDKAATLAGWSDLAMEVPRFRRIEPGDTPNAQSFVNGIPDSVVKANGGTEGFGARYLTRPDSRIQHELTRSLEFCWRHGAAIIQERRDGVLFRDPDHGGVHTLALRLNLVFDGRRHRLTSGFAQIGVDAWRPASCGHGGRILSLRKALSHLVVRSNDSRRVAGPDRSQWADIAHQAECAAGLFENLLLVGLDLLLDLDSRGRLVPVLLEANPRPAGLCHSRLLSELPSRNDQAGVGPALWDGLEALCRPSPLPAWTSLRVEDPMLMAGTP